MNKANFCFFAASFVSGVWWEAFYASNEIRHRARAIVVFDRALVQTEKELA